MRVQTDEQLENILQIQRDAVGKDFSVSNHVRHLRLLSAAALNACAIRGRAAILAAFAV